LGERPWSAGVFDDHYLRIFASALVDERTAAEVNGGDLAGGPLELDSSFLVTLSGHRGRPGQLPGRAQLPAGRRRPAPARVAAGAGL
jgi:hypothetical protein